MKKRIGLYEQTCKVLGNIGREGVILRPHQFNHKKLEAFMYDMGKLLHRLNSIKPYILKDGGPNELISSELYYWKATNKLDINNWHTILSDLYDKLSYYSDRWCYSRYVTVRRLYNIFLTEWECHKKWRNIRFVYDINGSARREKYQNIPLYGVPLVKK